MTLYYSFVGIAIGGVVGAVSDGVERGWKGEAAGRVVDAVGLASVVKSYTLNSRAKRCGQF